MNILKPFYTEEELCRRQLELLNLQLEYARVHSPFYRHSLKSGPKFLADLSELVKLPFLTAEELTRHCQELVCLPMSRVSRIVSLQTSGSVFPKRLFFSQGDLERTVSFFAEGMRYMTQSGQKVAVCMPGNAPNGISSLLVTGLRRIGAQPLRVGGITDFERVAALLRFEKPHTIVGFPSQLRRLALCAPDLRPENVLLSGDYLPQSVCATLSRIWGCDVFNHYGLTESGYGCAVECPSHTGQHIRHEDLVLEIADIQTGAVLPPGNWGEIILTTLRREAMPLIRYRTGDLGRLLTEPCGCGSQFCRLDRVKGRIAFRSALPSVYDLEELLYGMDTVLDFSARKEENKLCIQVLLAEGGTIGPVREAIEARFPDALVSVSSTLCLVSTGKQLIN